MAHGVAPCWLSAASVRLWSEALPPIGEKLLGSVDHTCRQLLRCWHTARRTSLRDGKNSPCAPAPGLRTFCSTTVARNSPTGQSGGTRTIAAASHLGIALSATFNI